MFEPSRADRRMVRLLAAQGTPIGKIAMCVGKDGVDTDTLLKHFRRDIEIAKEQVNALAMKTIVRAMRKGQPWAVILWQKCRGGWTESNRLTLEPGQPNGNSEAPVALMDMDRMIAAADTEDSRIIDVPAE